LKKITIFDGNADSHHDAYLRLDRSKMILRDFLAIDRTILSNQNTFLAYIRTALTLFVAGVTFIRFFDFIVIEVIGWIFIPVGLVTFIVGLIRYNKKRLVLDTVMTEKKPPRKEQSANGKNNV
jgi:putative membrane protein